MFPYTKQALQCRVLEVCAVERCSWRKFREIQSFAQQSSVPSTLQSCVFTQTCYISHLFTVVFPLLMRRGRFLTRLCVLLSFYLSVHETIGTFFSVFTASHHHCLHLAGACFYWHWILIDDARETLQEHFELSSLSYHFNSEIKPLMTNMEVWTNKNWGLWGHAGSVHALLLFFHWVMTLWKQITLYA